MTKITDLKTRFDKEIAPALQKELGETNVMSIPKVTKVTINVGIGSYIKAHGKDIDSVVENITSIAGQKPVVTKAKKAISNFKLREKEPVGITVTIRGKKMYDFLNTLTNVVFPRVRDFRGINPKAFDGNGNYSVGFKEHTVFPEINQEDISKIHGVQITIATNTKSDEKGLALLKALGFPFQKLTT